MGSTLTIALAAIVLGTLQLFTGIVIGRCLPGAGGRGGSSDPPDPEGLRESARRLYHLLRVVAEDVGKHHTEIGRASEHLATAQAPGGSQATQKILATVAQVVEINQRLQSRLASAEEKLQQQAKQIESHVNEARTDPLTGLPNRRAFDGEMGRRFAQWQRKQSPFCLVLIDVDRFKALNDRHGHPAGDEVLRELGDVFARTVREMDFVARVGGEEFAVVLPSTDSADAGWVAERLRTTVDAHCFPCHGSQLHVTVSIGAARIEPGEDVLALMRRADEALYVSKNSGRNCGHIHDGRTCRPLADDPAPGAPESPVLSTDDGSQDEVLDSTQADPELASLSEDLRSRLAEMAADGC